MQTTAEPAIAESSGLAASNSAPVSPVTEAALQPAVVPEKRVRLLLICSDDKVGSEIVLAAQVVGFDSDVCQREQALRLLTSHTYDAAVFNTTAPEQDFPLIEEARGTAKCRQIPIVVLAHPSDVNLAFRAGASFALGRPIGSDLLKNTLGAIYRLAVGQRRHYARIRVEMPVSLMIEGRPMEGKATDIGHGGMALVTAEPLESGTIACVQFVLPGSEERIIAFGDIRWTDHHGRSGLSFTNIADAGRSTLDNWIARRYAGIDDPAPGRANAPAEPPRVVTDPEAAADRTRDTSRLALIWVLTVFCMFIVGFWIYVLLTN